MINHDKSELVHGVLEGTVRGIVITDAEGTVQYANPRQCIKTGYCLEELIGANARIFQSGETPAAVYAAMWSTILAGEVWYGELLNRRKNKEPYWEFVHIYPVRNDSGDICQFLSIQEEIPGKTAAGQTTTSIRLRIDPLTGLLNRQAFNQSLSECINVKRLNQDNSIVTIYCINLDRFHMINRAIGFTKGDVVLAEVGQRMLGSVNREDTIARIGTDEFAVFLNRHDEEKETGETIIERILASVDRPMVIDGQELLISASAGGTRYPPDGHDSEELITKAQSAMRAAKGAGGNNFRWYDDAGMSGSVLRLDIDSGLRKAIDRDEFVLHYQPQVSLASGEIIGLEALIRWNRDGAGLIFPGAFIPNAENSDLIIDIGEWVLQAAVAQLLNWQKEKIPFLKIAINLSAKHFLRSDLPEFVERLILKNKIDPHYIELELTENAVLQDPTKVKYNIERLNALGVQIALDDFGTGQSSLVWLSQLPLDQLKIDRSFINDSTTNPINASIIAATIAMAHKLDKSVTAEGVETEAQLRFIRQLGCDFMQGYLFSKPCAADEIAVMLRENRRMQFGDQTGIREEFSLLLVDDEPQILELLKRVFHREGYRILTAANGDEALDVLAVNQIEVIISDHAMPGMSGVELLSRVRKLYPDIVRIILSGQGDMANIIDAVNRGAIWKYFSKPLDMHSLREVVRKACLERSMGC